MPESPALVLEHHEGRTPVRFFVHWVLIGPGFHHGYITARTALGQCVSLPSLHQPGDVLHDAIIDQRQMSWYRHQGQRKCLPEDYSQLDLGADELTASRETDPLPYLIDE